MIIIYLIIGFLLGITTNILFLKINKNKNSKSVPFLRRGIYSTSYSISDSSSYDSESIAVQYEIGEIEYSNGKSKVKTIDLSTSRSRYNKSGTYKDNLCAMIDNTWLDSSEIEWIDSSVQQRDDKINKILNNK